MKPDVGVGSGMRDSLRALLVCLVASLAIATPATSAPGEGELAEHVKRLVDDHRFEDALVEATNAADSAESTHGPDALPTAEALYLIGYVHYHQGDPGRALPHFERALRIAEGEFGVEHAELEVFVREYGATLYWLERYTEAETESERLHRIVVEKYGRWTAGTVPALYNLGLVRMTLGEYDDAEPLLVEAAEVLESQAPDERQSLSQVLDSHSTLHYARGLLPAALEVAERVLEIRESTDPDGATVARSLNNMARLLREIGDHQRAKELLDRALEMEADGTVGRALALRIRLNLAAVERELGDRARARELLEAVPGLLTEGERSGLYHMQLAELLVDEGEIEAARAQLELALDTYRSSVGEAHFHYAQVLVELAELEIASGELESAGRRAETALAVFESAIGQDHLWYASALGGLSVVRAAQGRLDDASTMGLDADRRVREALEDTLSFLPERQALRLIERPRHGRDVALSIALAPDADESTRRAVAESVVRGRALVFDEVASRQREYGAVDDPTVIGELVRLRDARSRLATLFLRGPGRDGARYARLLRATRDEIDAIEGDLARSSGESRTTASTFGVSELRGALDADAASVSYVRFRRHTGTKVETAYAAVVIDASDATPTYVDLGAAKRVEDAIADWHELTAYGATKRVSAEAEYRATAARLRQLVWDPVRPHVGDASLVHVTPDGSINLVSFATLPIDGNRYLVERGPTFHYLTAERDLARASRDSSAAELLLVGNPAFGTNARALRRSGASKPDEPCHGIEDVQFGSLPGTAREVRRVESLWSSSEDRGTSRSLTRLSGRDATERAVRRNVGGKGVIHFATHGFFLGDGCESTIAMRGVGGRAPRDGAVSTPPVNPLVLSGLVLAGVNDRRGRESDELDDGILTAAELSTLDLRDTSIAVLSACRTGAGTISEGEGVFGLRRALLTAGVDTVVTSLWDVEDRSATRWIEQFYGRWIEGGDGISLSLRKASRSILVARRARGRSTHPFFWGGWLAVGRAQ